MDGIGGQIPSHLRANRRQAEEEEESRDIQELLGGVRTATNLRLQRLPTMLAKYYSTTNHVTPRVGTRTGREIE